VVGAAHAGSFDRLYRRHRRALLDGSGFDTGKFGVTTPWLALLERKPAATAAGKRKHNDGADEILGHSRHTRTMARSLLRSLQWSKSAPGTQPVAFVGLLQRIPTTSHKRCANMHIAFRCHRQKISSKRQMVAKRNLTNSPDRPEHFGDAARLALRKRR
jgi:hypothetical protein